MLDRGPAAPLKGEQLPPTFRPTSVVAKRLDGSRRHLVRRQAGLVPGHIMLDRDPVPTVDNNEIGDRSWSRPHRVRQRSSCPPERGTAPPTFRPMSVVAKQPDGSRRHLVRRQAGLGPGHIMLDRDPVPTVDRPSSSEEVLGRRNLANSPGACRRPGRAGDCERPATDEDRRCTTWMRVATSTRSECFPSSSSPANFHRRLCQYNYTESQKTSHLWLHHHHQWKYL